MITKYFFAVFLGLSSFAQAQALDERCTKVAGEYLIRGDMDSPFGGDRLWSLERIQGAFQADAASECISSIRTKALADANEYWGGYVAAKYSCNGPDSLAPPAEKPEACPNEKWAAIKENLSYIESIETGRISVATKTKRPKKTKAAELCEKNDGPIDKIKELTAAIPAAAATDACAKFNIKKEFRKDTPVSSSSSNFLMTCYKGAKDGLQKLVDTFKSDYFQLAKFVKDPAYRASAMSAVSDLASILATSPAKVFQAIADTLDMNYREHSKEVQCLNSDGVKDYLCKELAQKGLPALLGVGAIRGIAMLLKGGKKITPGLVAIKDASRTVETKLLSAPQKLLAGSAKSTSGSAKASSASAKKAKRPSNSKSTAGNKAQEKPATDSNPNYAEAAKTTPEARAKNIAAAKERIEAAKKRKAEAALLAKRNNISPQRDAALIKKIKATRTQTFGEVLEFLGAPRNTSRADAKKMVQKYLRKFHHDHNPDYPEISAETSGNLGEMLEVINSGR